MKSGEKRRQRSLLIIILPAIAAAAFFFQAGGFFTEVFSQMEKEGKQIPASSLVVPEYPRIVSIMPADGAKDVLLGIEDPITVRFEKSAREFFIDFRFEPEVPVAYENDQEKTEFRLLPRNPLSADMKYLLKIYAKRRGEGGKEEYRKLRETVFTTLPEQPEQWSADLMKRLEEARRYARPLMKEGKYIDVNLKNQILSTFDDGKLLDAYSISTGRRGMETPQGIFEIHNKASRPWSKTYSLFMPYWMAITADGKIGIHELPEWPGGYKEGADHLGTPVSHGCIRLGVGAAAQVWNWADIGTAVVVH